MQVPVLGCTFLTLSDQRGPDDRCPAVPPASSAHLCPAVRPLAPPTCAQQITHLCPAVHPPVP
ncbi:unnamed protein product, partial [Staurois parvus]